ncbi:uncharacterized protein LOC127847727 [Dreissena polymorpha]|uniref:Uncharacterized protein n=1 Tax=Dreissena polymorpha TaxID=45954 RepID=A0A9D4DPB8_DREPO|nr:uncharacterized protein LOC127847727 [Dreissena polymorpha]KAH3752613.1 hypothetical protein DPMN_187234 [Dreissena polymorpha]
MVGNNAAIALVAIATCVVFHLDRVGASCCHDDEFINKCRNHADAINSSTDATVVCRHLQDLFNCVTETTPECIEQAVLKFTITLHDQIRCHPSHEDYQRYQEVQVRACASLEEANGKQQVLAMNGSHGDHVAHNSHTVVYNTSDDHTNGSVSLQSANGSDKRGTSIFPAMAILLTTLFGIERLIL